MKIIYIRKLISFLTSLITTNILLLTLFNLLFSLRISFIKTIIFILFIFFLISIYLLLNVLHKKYEVILQKKKEGNKNWSVSLLGPSRTFEVLKFDILEKRYKTEVDMLLVIIPSFIFIVIFFLNWFLKNYLNIDLLIIRKDILATIFALFISYLLFLIISFLFIYEEHIALKRGKLYVGDDTWYALIFFLTIDISFLIKFLFDSVNILFLKV